MKDSPKHTAERKDEDAAHTAAAAAAAAAVAAAVGLLQRETQTARDKLAAKSKRKRYAFEGLLFRV